MFTAEYIPPSPTNTQWPSRQARRSSLMRATVVTSGRPAAPRTSPHAVARHREYHDHLGLVVKAFLAVAAPAQWRIEPSAPFRGLLIRFVDLEISRGGVAEDQIDIEPD